MLKDWNSIFIVKYNPTIFAVFTTFEQSFVQNI